VATPSPNGRHLPNPLHPQMPAVALFIERLALDEFLQGFL
jgi:hypothetical protein